MKPYLVLLAICIFGFVIRFYHVESIPKGTLVDEASFGYIAHSLLETGKDEHSKSWPLLFTAFGDQKLPAYAYVLLPFIKILGMNTLTVRLPSVLAGTLLIAIVYFLLIEVGFSKKQSLVGSLVTAVAPWTLILSRFGYESNLGLLFFTLALVFLFRFFNKKTSYLIALSALCMGLTWYTYISYRLVTVLFSVIFFIYLFFAKKVSGKNIFWYIIPFILVLIPLFPYAFGKAGVARFNQVGILSNQGYVLEINESRDFCRKSFPTTMCYAAINKGTIYARAIAYNYVDTLSPIYMFMRGEEASAIFGIDNVGLFPFILLPFYILGIVAMLLAYRKKESNRFTITLILIGLIIAALPSVLVGLPQKVRLTPLFPFILMLLMFGYASLEGYKKDRLYKNSVMAVVVIGLLLSSAFINLQFVVHSAKHEDVYGGYIPEFVDYIASQPNDTQIYIKPFFSEPLMYYAYFTAMPGREYQKNVVLGPKEANGFQHAIQLENIHITELLPSYIPCLQGKQRALYVTNDNLQEMGLTKDKPVYEGRSENKALTFLHVYDIKSIEGTGDCSKEQQ